ncbi:protein PPP1R35 homolog [Topomyia yanbarensis]|uniref:protein PPP1R35 homolog n=1 Tax=Topomyia yanbarensis TaxID=2498891 RepID=UPI00273BBDF8|nr:protein PPP1R35 homolog [Topomyia yanbarensis]
MKKSKYRKCFLRGVEVPLATSNARVLKPTSGDTNIIPKEPIKRIEPVRRSTVASNKFKQPELHTALNVRKQIEKVSAVNSKAPTSIGELTPKSKKFVREEITKKLNFQHDENVFKGLVPVNVNDSVLIPVAKKPIIRAKFVTKAKRDPEPELADFLRPIPKFNIDFDPYLPPESIPRKPNFNNFDNIMDVFAKIDVGA